MLMFGCVSKAVNSFCQVLLPLVHIALAWPAITVCNTRAHFSCCTANMPEHALQDTDFQNETLFMLSLVCFVVNSHHYIISDKLSQTPGICTYNSCTALKNSGGHLIAQNTNDYTTLCNVVLNSHLFKCSGGMRCLCLLLGSMLE